MEKLRQVLLAILVVFAFGCEDSNDSASVLPGGSGNGGSLARFSIVGDQLYVVNNRNLITFDISDPKVIQETDNTDVGFGIETIFPFGQNLFIGSESAMYIYDISEPQTPQLVSTYPHITNCDPVVVQGNYAYSSLRGSANCRFGGQDRVEIVDVSDLFNPTQISIFQDVITPYGLGIKGDVLYLCQGEFGLHMINVANPAAPFSISTMENINSFDVIVENNRLILTGADGIFQYDISDPGNLVLLSKIELGL